MKQISEEALDVMLDLYDAASSGRWPQIKQHVLDMGYTPEDVVRLTNEISIAAGRDPLFEESDFS